MIIEEYDESLFIQRFENMKRVVTLENKNGNFSYRGLRALFEYLNDSFDDDNPYKLDVIALCCDYSEYDNVQEYITDYNTDLDKKDFDDDEDFYQALEEEISDKTTLIKIDEDLNEGFIIQGF